jgi:prevent-host-death family protein
MTTTVNMHEAKTKLSKLVEAVEGGTEAEIIIARNGQPVAKLVPVGARRRRPIGLYNGVYPDVSLEEFNATDDEIADLMINGPLFPPEEAPVSPKVPRRKRA